MQKLLLMGLACFCLQQVRAQKIVEKHMDFSQKSAVALNLQIADSIRIITWNKNEVFVKASVDIDDNKNNDIYAINFDDSGSTIDVKSRFAERPKVVTNDSCHCCSHHSKIYFDVFIPENARFSVETIDGNITITGLTDEIKAHSISGFIDLTLAANRKADFRLNTISGTIYSNLALSEDPHKIGGNTIVSDYNGGGKAIDLNTISGDIFVRKQE